MYWKILVYNQWVHNEGLSPLHACEIVGACIVEGATLPILALFQGKLTLILQQVYTGQFPVAPAILNWESIEINEVRNDKGTNHVPFIHMPLEGLDLCKIPCVFGLENCIFVRGLPFCILSMKMFCWSKGVCESLVSSLLMTCIVMWAMGFMSMLGANDPTGIYLNHLVLLSPKVSAYGNHRGGCCRNSKRHMEWYASQHA